MLSLLSKGGQSSQPWNSLEMNLGGKWFLCAIETYLLPKAFAANQRSNFPCDHFMLQFYQIFCSLWTPIWNWNSTFFCPGWWGRMSGNAFVLKWESSKLPDILVVGLWRKWKNDLNGLAATTHVRATFIPGLPALTCSNVILSAEARGVTTMLLSAFQLYTPLAWEHRGFPSPAYLSIWLCHATKVSSGRLPAPSASPAYIPRIFQQLY